MKIRLSKPYLGNTNKLGKLIVDILKNGFLTQGKYVAQFEKLIADYLGIKHAIAVSSGTAALHLSLIALEVGPQDEVIVPVYTFPATVNVVELVGAKPVFVDVDLDTYNLDINKIEKAFSRRTKAIIPVHLFGNPVDMDYIIQFAKKREIAVIEDSAGALGSKYKGIKCGTMGQIGCFSFHPRKILTTGEGGMVVTNNEKYAQKIRSLRNHGIELNKAHKDFISPGFNYRMNELEAVLGIVQIRSLESTVLNRQSIARYYMDSLKVIPNVVFQKILPDCLSTWQAFVIRLKKRQINTVLKILKQNGIEADIGSYALHVLRFYSNKYMHKASEYPNALQLYKTAIALPFFNGLGKKTIGKIKKVLARANHEN